MPSDGEERSQAYYLVKAAQEREELQRQGDELDQRIRKGEKEIRALQNTLDMMNSRNHQYRQVLSKSDPSSREAQQKEELEGQFQTMMATYKMKRQELQSAQNDLVRSGEQVKALQNDQRAATASAQAVQAEYVNLQRELDDLEVCTRQLTHLIS